MAAKPTEWKALLAERFADSLARRGMNQEQLAAALGVSAPAVSRWLSEKGGSGWRRLGAICEALGESSDYLLGLTAQPKPEVQTIDGESFVTLPCLVDELAAGVPLLALDRFSSDRYAFRAGWFDRVKVPPDKLFLARLAASHHGQSMQDTIQPGALIAIDTRPVTRWSTAMNKRIFVVRDPGSEGVTVKRVTLRGEQLVCTPDNPEPNHLPFAIDLAGRALQEILVGRVVWWANGAP